MDEHIHPKSRLLTQHKMRTLPSVTMDRRHSCIHLACMSQYLAVCWCSWGLTHSRILRGPACHMISPQSMPHYRQTSLHMYSSCQPQSVVREGANNFQEWCKMMAPCSYITYMSYISNMTFMPPHTLYTVHTFIPTHPQTAQKNNFPPSSTFPSLTLHLNSNLPSSPIFLPNSNLLLLFFTCCTSCHSSTTAGMALSLVEWPSWFQEPFPQVYTVDTCAQPPVLWMLSHPLQDLQVHEQCPHCFCSVEEDGLEEHTGLINLRITTIYGLFRTYN